MVAARAVAETWGNREVTGIGGSRPLRRQAARRRPSEVARLAFLFAVVGTLLLLYVAEQAWVISLTYRLNGVKTALHSAAVETDRLQLQISELSSPERIERVAREELKLVSPGKPAYLTGAAKVALVKPAAQERGLPMIARIQRFFRGSPVQAAHAAP
ncbi:MAG: hypothetical protein ACM3XZ_00785 [Betaproteobacteria bacterium]